jgi:hypothetical protein
MVEVYKKGEGGIGEMRRSADSPAAIGVVLVRSEVAEGQDVMTSIEGDGHDKADSKRVGGALLSTRTLLILCVSTVVGLAIGISAGVAAGLGALPVAGGAGAVAVGFVAGLGAATLSALTVAGALHVLVGKETD